MSSTPKRLNTLILDDNVVISNCISKRIFRANATYGNFNSFEIIPFTLEIDIDNFITAAEKIETFIIKNSIEFLLIDRGFYKVIDPSKIDEYSVFNQSKLYTKRTDLENGIKIEEILKLIPKSSFNTIKGVLVYTYDDEGEYIEAEYIKELYLNILPNTFDKSMIDVILSNSETYKLANLSLYIDKPDNADPEMIDIGNKSDFKLYGLFIGEILYHRTAFLLSRKKQNQLQSRKYRVLKNYLLLFLVFSTLSIGSSALYSILDKYINNNYLLVFTSIIFSLVLPIFILLTKPKLLLDIDTEE